MELIEIKNMLEERKKAYDELQKAVTDLKAAQVDGKALGDLTAKVETLSKACDQFDELKAAVEDIQKKANRPSEQESKSAAELAAEVKGFNIALRADFQSKGRAFPGDLSAETYVQYKSAFYKLAVGVPVDNLGADERKALSAGADPDGGYMLPQSTMGRTVAKIYEQSIMRQLAQADTISTDKMEGLVDNGEAGAGWVSELGSRTDTSTPQVGKWEIVAHEMYAMPKASQKILDDAATDVEAWLSSKVADKFARVEGAAFWTGSGVGQPRGLASYTTAATGDDSRAWGQFEHVVTGANGGFHTTKLDPIQDLQGTLKDQYLQNATFVMRREVRTAARKLKESTSDRYLWEPSLQVGQPDRLNGIPVRVDQYMPALATGSLSLALGDFKQAYQIVDRMGIRTLRDPFTAKPYVVFYSTKRTGGGAVNFEAVKFLKFSA